MPKRTQPSSLTRQYSSGRTTQPVLATDSANRDAATSTQSLSSSVLNYQ